MIAEVFLQYSIAKVVQYLERIEVCLGKLSNEAIWLRGHSNENSVGNLCLHLSGNVRQWIVSGIGKVPDRRNRDGEFAAVGGYGSAELREIVRQAVREATEIIGTLAPERLEEQVTIQSYELTVIEAIYHVVEHFSHHTGQILFATKALTGEDLGFYRHLAMQAHVEKTP